MSVWVCFFQDRTYIDRSFVVLVWVRVAPISIDHLPISLSLSFWVGTAPISICHSSCQFESGPHLCRLTIFLSVWVWVFKLGPHLYRSVMFLSLFVFSLSWDRTYIDRSLSYQLEFGAALTSIVHLFVMLVQFLGPHLYRLIIFRVSLNRGRTYIDWSFVMSVRVSGLHLYRSVIVLSNWVESCLPPSRTCIVESCSILSYHFYLVLVFRDIVHIHSGTLSHHLSLFFMFKVISPQLYHSKS